MGVGDNFPCLDKLPDVDKDDHRQELLRTHQPIGGRSSRPFSFSLSSEAIELSSVLVKRQIARVVRGIEIVWVRLRRDLVDFPLSCAAHSRCS